MFTIDTKQEVLDLGSNPIKLSEDGEKFLTYGLVIANSLLAPRGQKEEVLFDKATTFSLAMRFFNDDTVEMEAGDINKILKILEGDPSYNALVVGQVQLKLQGLIK